MAKPATLDHLRSRKKPTTREVNIVLDPKLADRYAEAKEKVDTLEMRLRSQPENDDLDSDHREAVRELERVKATMEEEDAVVTFRFRSLPPHEYDDLIHEHPATKDQRQEARAIGERLNYNVDTFPPALVAACLDEPKLSLDEVEQLWKDPNWNSAELQALFVGALSVNSTRRTVDEGKG